MDIYNQFMELRGSNSILTGRSHSFLLSLDQNPKMNQSLCKTASPINTTTSQVFRLISYMVPS